MKYPMQLRHHGNKARADSRKPSACDVTRPRLRFTSVHGIVPPYWLIGSVSMATPPSKFRSLVYI
jgi:hypothetical protein